MDEYKITYNLKNKHNNEDFDKLHALSIAFIAAKSPEEAKEKLIEEFNMLKVEIFSVSYVGQIQDVA